MHALGMIQTPSIRVHLSPSIRRLSPPSPFTGISKKCSSSGSLSFATPIKCGSILSFPSQCESSQIDLLIRCSERCLVYILGILTRLNFVGFVAANEAMKGSTTENLVPLRHTIFSDHLTPVLAYRCLVKEDDRESPSFLFESVEPGTQASTVVPTLLLLLLTLTLFC